MEITGRKLIVKALLEEGVKTVFAYPGGMITDILDELYKTEEIHMVLPRHEQALIHEAEGYARATGKTAVALVTSGPGATNAITGIADANSDSIPLVVITGQVSRPLIGNDAFQEVDIIGATRNIVKWGVTVKDRKSLGRILKMAFYIANSGKPGPVVIDIPKDLQQESGPAEYPDSVQIRGYKVNETAHVGQLKKAYRLLKTARRPVILAGGGVNISGAHAELAELAEKMHIPVVTTVMGKGAMDASHPLYVGNSGMHGRYAANYAVADCDVLLSVGTRFNDRITGDLNEFAPEAKIIHMDIDTSSISRNVVVDIPIVCDAKQGLAKLCEWAEPLKTDAWIRKIDQWQKDQPIGMRRDKGMTAQMIMEGIDKVYPTGYVVTDVGQNQMWAAQYIELGPKKRMITSGGLGTMGFGFPAAIGAKIAKPEENVVCITGDGGFQMNMQEMATAVLQEAGVTVCILNNKYLGMVRQQQQYFYGKRYESVCLNRRKTCPRDCKGPNDTCGVYVPDFIDWAKAYRVEGIRVSEESEIIPALEKAKKNQAEGKPTVIEFMIATEDNALPMVMGGRPMTDMILK